MILQRITECRNTTLLVTHILASDFKVPIFNDLWHSLRMQAAFSVSIKNEFAHAALGNQHLNRRLLQLENLRRWACRWTITGSGAVPAQKCQKAPCRAPKKAQDRR
jgi:hypothetical protein